jgi:hypothetical protein
MVRRCYTPGARVRTDGATLLHAGCARAHRWCDVATRRVRACAPMVQRCYTPGAHVRTDGATLLHAWCARAHRWCNVAARGVRTCAPMVQRCYTPRAHVRTQGATLRHGVVALRHVGCRRDAGGGQCDAGCRTGPGSPSAGDENIRDRRVSRPHRVLSQHDRQGLEVRKVGRQRAARRTRSEVETRPRDDAAAVTASLHEQLTEA